MQSPVWAEEGTITITRKRGKHLALRGSTQTRTEVRLDTTRHALRHNALLDPNPRLEIGGALEEVLLRQGRVPQNALAVLVAVPRARGRRGERPDEARQPLVPITSSCVPDDPV